MGCAQIEQRSIRADNGCDDSCPTGPGNRIPTRLAGQQIGHPVFAAEQRVSPCAQCTAMPSNRNSLWWILHGLPGLRRVGAKAVSTSTLHVFQHDIGGATAPTLHPALYREPRRGCVCIGRAHICKAIRSEVCPIRERQVLSYWCHSHWKNRYCTGQPPMCRHKGP